MTRDIHKLSEWLENTLRIGVADERLLREMKLSQKRQSEAAQSEPGSHSKAS